MELNIYRLKELLKYPKGINAQLKMAPKLRRKELEEYHNHEIKSKSAVLILIFIENNDYKIILTKRSNKLRKHSGQISFPGGKYDDNDSNLQNTAFRESEEEIGLKNKDITVLGWLSPLIIPITNFEVHPLVAFSNETPKLEINKDEVEQIIIASINKLTDINNIKRTSFGNSSSGRFIEAPYFEIENHKIWGATAMIISELLLTVFPESKFSKHEMSFY